MKKLLLALVAVASAASALAQSAVPNLMSYQSRVADAAGVPLGNTTPVNRIVLFRIYDSPSLSAPANRLYSEQQTVTIAAGEFSVLIGSGTAISTESSNPYTSLSAAVFGGATRYLGVTVDDGDGNPFNDPEMSPRQQIVGTPFAFRAQTAEAVALGGVNALSLANNSVTTAAIAPGAITNDKLAPAAVDTAQVADNAVTLAKHAANSVDSSKIVDGSIQLADLSSSVRAVMPKPRYVYNQGMGTSSGMANIIFPIDIGELGNDADGCLITYQGQARSLSTGGTLLPAFFTGTIRVSISQFLSAGTANPTAINAGPGSKSAASAAATLGEATAPIVMAQHTSVTGTTFYYAGLTAGFSVVSSTGTTPNPWYSGFSQSLGGVNSSGIHLISPLAKLEFTASTSLVTNAPFGVFQLFHFYPGSLNDANNSSTLPTAPFDLNQANISTNANAGGPPRTHSATSVVTGTNKLTITVDNPHAIQVGDTLTIASMTGAPAANGTYTVSAVPDRLSFEIPLTSATGVYTGGTITHTPKYNKYRLWVAVRAEVAMRFVVSDY